MGVQIILASASPRRQALLRQIGVSFRQQVTEIDETPRENETADDYVTRLALEKARAVHAQLGNDELPVLGADTAVVVDGRPLGKPRDAQHARALLGQLSGREHRVLSAVALVAGHEAVCVSHQLPVETLRRSMTDKQLHHFPTKRMCNLASVTSFYFHGELCVGWGYAELAGQ